MIGPSPRRNRDLLRVQAILWNSLGRGSVAYSVNEILNKLPDEDVERALWCLSGDVADQREYHRPALPHLMFSALCKLRAPAALHIGLARQVALRNLASGDIVYAWPPYDLNLIRRAQERGAIVVAERINCMGQMVRAVLTKAYARRGLAFPNALCTREKVIAEREQMLQCDYVTAPNALVAQSLLEAGIAQHRILETSYGFDPHRLAAGMSIQRPDRPPVFAFVGLGIVRKGLDVLLEAWERSGITGKLLIAGNIEGDIRREYARTLARHDVEELGYVQDIAQVYGAADVFVFPTHEEGGPQVTYEAAACALPSIVSPMGAGRIIRHEQEGLIIDPLSVDSVADAIVSLADDRARRLALGENAARRAQEFTWSKVARRLYKMFREITGRDPNPPNCERDISPTVS